MMKHTYLFLFSCFLFALMGCGQETDIPEVTDSEDVSVLIPLQFTVEANVQNRAVISGGFPVGSSIYSIGMSVCEENTTSTPLMDGYINLEARYKRTTETSSEWHYWWNEPKGTNGTAVYTEHDVLSVIRNRAADIYAYYPYVAKAADGTSALTDITAIPVTFDKQTDWMYADKVALLATQTTGTSVAAHLSFKHTLTCIEIRIKNLFTGNVTLSSITLTDKAATADVTKSRLYSTGTLNAITGTITKGTQTGEITLTPNAVINQTNFASFYFIIPEVESYNSRDFELSFKFNNVPAADTYTIPVTTTSKADGTGYGFLVGNRYQYQLEVNNTMKFTTIGTLESDPATWTEVTATTDFVL